MATPPNALYNRPISIRSEVVVTAIGQVEIMRAGQNSPPFTISATHQKSRQIVGRGGHVKIINDGLAEFAHAASFEPKMREALAGKTVARLPDNARQQ